MPAPDPTAPEVKELLHTGYSLQDLKDELVRETHRRDDPAARWSEDEMHILNTWITALKGELVRREAGVG
jgi:hypothetical protein